MNDFFKWLSIVVFTLVIVGCFILTPLSFVFSWSQSVKVLLVFCDIGFFALICSLINESVTL